MRTTTTRVLIAAGLLALTSPAISAETTGRSVASEPAEAWDTGRASGDVPFPHLPWMTSERGEPVQAEGLLGPRLQTLGPFLLQPSMASTTFSSGPATTGTQSE